MKFRISLLLLGGHILSAFSENITYGPSMAPTFGPTPFPSPVPTHLPTNVPTNAPTPVPTFGPSPYPSLIPTASPSVNPTPSPTSLPSIAPTSDPTHDPTPSPTVGPTITPTGAPSSPPSFAPSGLPTMKPSRAPTHSPTSVPYPNPTITLAPTTETASPTAQPTLEPTAVGGRLFTAYNKTISVRVPQIGAPSSYSVTGYPNVDDVAWGNVAGNLKIFWTDIEAGTVSRANFDFTDIEVIMTDLDSPRGIHIGVGSPWMFITGDKKHGITRATVNGTHKKILVNSIPGITGVCHAGPWVYFTSSSHQRLYRINKDGDQIRSIYDFEGDEITGYPMSVTYLPGMAVRPWAGPGEVAEFKEGHVYVITTTDVVRMGPEGSKAKKIVTNLTDGYSIDINIANGKLYFSDTGVGVYQCNLHGGGFQLNTDQAEMRGVSIYTSSKATTHAPTQVPTKIPTPYPTATRYPTSLPTQIPSPMPTPEPTYIWGTLLFSAGERPYSNGPFKYVKSTDTYTEMSRRANGNVNNIAVMRNEGEETLVVYTDATLDAVFTVPLVGEASTLPTLLYKGCNEAGAITVPRGKNYIYVACRTYGLNSTYDIQGGRPDPISVSFDGSIEIVRMNKDGSNATVIANGNSGVGPLTSMATTDDTIYFTTVKGQLKSMNLEGSGLRHLVSNLRDPSSLVISRQSYFGGEPMMYVSTKNAIWKISMDGRDITKLVEGLWDCSGLALDLSHGRMYWADFAADGIFSSKLDGSDFTTEVNIKYPTSVFYYTDIASQKSSLPSATPSEAPSPVPTVTYRPTPSPSTDPSPAPTPVPTYYFGRLYMSADGGFYESIVGSTDAPTRIFTHTSDCRGITTTSSPPYVYWIDGTQNEIYKAAMDSDSYTTIYTLSGTDDIYDIVASDDYLFVSGSASNTIIKMDHDGTNDEILLSGYGDVKGLDIDEDTSTIYFASASDNSVFSMSFDGGTVTTLTDTIDEPTDVVVYADFQTLYIICDTVIWLTDLDGSNPIRLMNNFTKATSATIQYGQHRLWIADEEGDAVYQAELTGHDVVERFSIDKPKYISFYTSSGAYTNSPTFSPSHGPSEAPSQFPTVSPTTPEPTSVPSSEPSALPSFIPTAVPTLVPSPGPTQTPTVTPNFLFYASGSDSTNGKITRATTDGAETEDYVVGGLPTDLAIEPDSKYLYWTDSDAGEIYRTQVGSGGDSGTSGVEVIVSGLTSPTGIAASFEGGDDLGGPHIFWTDPVEGKLYRCNKDGSNAYTMIDDLVGITGVVATYQYVYFTMEDMNDIYRVSFSCGEDDDDCEATQVLIGVCDKPTSLSYSPQTELMYCACKDSILNVKVYKQQGFHDEPMETILNKFSGSLYNDVVYNFDAAGLYISMYNESKLYYMPDVLITDSFDDDDKSDDDKAFDNFESELTTIATQEYIRAVAVFDSGVILDGETLSDGSNSQPSLLLRQPERLFATIDDDGVPISDSRVLLSSLESLSQKASRLSGSVLTPESRTSSSSDAEATSRDLHADFAAHAADTEEHASPAPAAAAAGAIAVFAALALANRKKKNGKSKDDKSKKKHKRNEPETFGPRAGYASLD
jgi:hypothetical protein